MAKEIFDQDRPRSTMARRLDEAFAGCEQWTLAPPSPRRSELPFDFRVTGPETMTSRAAAARPQSPGAL